MSRWYFGFMVRRKLTYERQPRITRRGIRISSRLHWFRLILFMILIPLLTWYGNQRYTNPFRLHPNIAVSMNNGYPVIHLYETTYRDTVNRFTITHEENSILEDSGVVLNYNKRGVAINGDTLFETPFHYAPVSMTVQEGVLIIGYYDNTLAISLNSEHTRSYQPCDIFVSHGITDSMTTELRRALAPRLTLIADSTYGSNVNSLPSNVLPISDGEMVVVDNGKYRNMETRKVKIEEK